MKRLVFGFFAILFSLVLVSSFAFAQTDPDYKKALNYYNNKKYKEAAELLKEYSKKNPSAEAYYRAGYSLYKIGKYDEANEYFKEAYLIDPSFAYAMPVVKEQATVTPGEAAKPAEKPATEQKPAAAAKPEVKKESAAKPAAQPQPQKPETAKTPEKAAAKPEAKKAESQKIQPPATTQEPAPMPVPAMPKAAPGVLVGLFAGLGMIVLLIFVAIYVFFSFCMFLIAKKLDVPSPWLAFIPIAQLWTFVSCAGKPWWWIVLIFIPIVSIFAMAYLWMCITENLGKNKWLGLLMLVPIVNLVWLIMLAFSKSGSYSPPADTAPISEEPPAEEPPLE